MEKEKIESLRKIFTVTNAAFEFAATVIKSATGKYNEHPMHTLHRQMNIELQKENPNPELLDKLLAEMEAEAQRNQPHPEFDKGGVSKN